jgi:hypothetical protein
MPALATRPMTPAPPAPPPATVERPDTRPAPPADDDERRSFLDTLLRALGAIHS